MRSIFSLAVLIVLSLAALSAADPVLGLSPETRWPRAGERTAVLVHGINPDHADLDALAGDLHARGYTVLRFVYDDSDRLDASAGQLARGIEALATERGIKRLAVVAHSMGGLVARRALTPRHGLGPLGLQVEFMSVASPFGGFGSANWSRLDFGLGRKVFHDLGSRAKFIREPGELLPGVTHTKVETDEHNRTLRGREDDSVPLKSQTQASVDSAARARHRLALGHVGSVNDEQGRVPPAVQALLSEVLGPRTRSLPSKKVPVRPARGLVDRVNEEVARPESKPKRRRMGPPNR